MKRSDVVLRLSDSERSILKLLQAALNVSEYTDDVDSIRAYSRENKMLGAMQEMFVAVAGLSLAAGALPPDVKEQLKDAAGSLTPIEPILQQAFEIGRRFKRLNPEKMRGDYGKLLMILQDGEGMRLSRLGLDKLTVPVKTVGSALTEIGCEEVLVDSFLPAAIKTNCTPEQRTEKEQSIRSLVEKYGGGDPEKGELIDRCIRSIADVDDFILINLRPILTLQKWLTELFQSGDTDATNLSIFAGKGGSMLTHGHTKQWKYVMESLKLWEIIHRRIFDFWEVVETDMIGRPYRFVNTGQGYNRVCGAPNTARRMSTSLAEAQAAMGGEWQGIHVVHLGDNDVPNALVFIDKYTVIPSLLNPVVDTIKHLEVIYDESTEEAHPGIRNLLRSRYGSFEDLRAMILRDFFRHAFDGSGDDGGNCIDGRLTSAWNWCQLLEKKKYYQAFVLTGFNGFDTMS